MIHTSSKTLDVEVSIVGPGRHESAHFNTRDEALIHIGQSRSDRADETILMITTEVFQ